MFARLFAFAGLSLDRLRALVEVGAAGGIARATGGDTGRQSQYSRQIKELEDFFQTRLVERQGKGIRLTASGRELARVSRFFLLGLSNFQRGCLAEEQSFRIGASATVLQQLLLPVLAGPRARQAGRYVLETAGDLEIERRLHDLTLDFGVVTAATISRPLQLGPLGTWRLRLWAPKALAKTEAQAVRALKEKRLPLALPPNEVPLPNPVGPGNLEPRLSCASFLDARAALETGELAAILPDFLIPEHKAGTLHRLRIPALEEAVYQYRLAWNPRLLRLNPHASRRRDFLLEALALRMRAYAASGATRLTEAGEAGRDPTGEGAGKVGRVR